MNNKFKVMFFTLLLGVFAFGGVFPAYAIPVDPIAPGTAKVNLREKVYKEVGTRVNSMDIGRTSDASLTAQIETLTGGVTGMGFSGTGECMMPILSAFASDSANKFANLGDCNAQTASSATSLTTGGMFQVAYDLSNTLTREPIPVNFAYYLKDNAKKLPIIKDTAYAATSYPNAFGVEMVYAIWQAVRNVAYGLLSIIMLIIGIMISIRYKLDAKTSVTVQAAIPRVIIAVVLITFSYPLGALIVSLARPLSWLAFDILSNDAWDTLFDPNTMMALGMLLALHLRLTAIALAGSALMFLFMIVLLVIAFIKAITIYVGLILDIITAPLEFALSAIPGNEKKVEEWFKKMLAKMLTIPAMFFMIFLPCWICNTAITGMAKNVFGQFTPIQIAQSINDGTFGTDIAAAAAGPESTANNPLNWASGKMQEYNSQTMALVFIPIVMISLWMSSLSVGDQINAMFGIGDKKAGGKGGKK